MGNRTRGVYDPGAVSGTLQEADLVLQWAHRLRVACMSQGIEVWMTRSTQSEPCPLITRTTRAVQAGCTHLISLHINADQAAQANGVETLHRAPPTPKAVHEAETYAEALHDVVIKSTGLRNRGVKVRRDLAVLRHRELTAAMLELGFIGNRGDMKLITAPPVIQNTTRALAAALKLWAIKNPS